MLLVGCAAVTAWSWQQGMVSLRSVSQCIKRNQDLCLYPPTLLSRLTLDYCVKTRFLFLRFEFSTLFISLHSLTFKHEDEFPSTASIPFIPGYAYTESSLIHFFSGPEKFQSFTRNFPRPCITSIFAERKEPTY